MSDELKPCAHCGNTDNVEVMPVWYTSVGDNYHVVCNWNTGGCGAMGGARRTKAEAIAAWNARADDAPEHPVDNAQADSRERLEADIKKYRLEHGETNLRVAKWLDRQAEITSNETSHDNPYVGLVRGKQWERTEISDYYCGKCGWKVTDHDSYCPECGGALHKAPNKPDGKFDVRRTTETHETDTSKCDMRDFDADSRERLEADLKTHLYEFGGYCFNSREGHTDNVDTFFDDFVFLLDRQVSITRAEVFEDGKYDCRTCDAKRELQKRMDSLTAERDELRDIIDHMPKTEQECEACQEAHDRLMFNAKVHQDELRDKLREKQHVCDVQRDSFLKLEREYRELQDVCGELERTVENMRGD